MTNQQNLDVLDVIERSRVEGNRLYLPEELGRDTYQQVAKLLNSLGGFWKKKPVEAFVFEINDAQEIVDAILDSGETNPVKKYQFFPTPPEVAAMMVDEITVELPEDRTTWLLEPSAGDGALIKAVWDRYPDVEFDTYELWDQNRAKLEKLKSVSGARVLNLGQDFLVADPNDDKATRYPVVIANPPFTKNQDVQHVLHMMPFLIEGGQLIAIMSTHWQFANDRLSRKFRSLVKGLSSCIEVRDIPAGTFAKSGTQVPTCLFIFNA